MTSEGPEAPPQEEMGGDPVCLLGLFCEDCGVEIGVGEHRPDCHAGAGPEVRP